MKKIFKKIWIFLSGKKTIIGASIMLAAKGGKTFFPDLLAPEQYEFIETLGEGITTLGIGHKMVKAENVNEAIKRATKRFRR